MGGNDVKAADTAAAGGFGLLLEVGDISGSEVENVEGQVFLGGFKHSWVWVLA